MAKGEERPTTIHISVSTINFLGAIVFTVGCCVLVCNAVLSFLPFSSPEVELPKGVIYVEGGLSLMSNALFLCGSLFAFIQVINAKRNSQPGSGGHHTRHGVNIATCVDPPPYQTLDATNEEKDDPPPPYTPVAEEYWRVFPTVHDLWTYYIHEMGFVATSIFLFSSLVYFSSSVASIVTIAVTGEIAICIRYPQLVAAVGFAAASIMMMLQVQSKFWKPALHSLRWHINFLNLVGSAGFIFCACFGLIENVYWAKYQFGMSYLWGSWAFLFGSLMQWWRSIGKKRFLKAKVSNDTNV